MAVDGTYNLTIQTPMGAQNGKVTLDSSGGELSGTMVAASGEEGPIQNPSMDGDKVKWSVDVEKPMPLTLTFEGVVEGDKIGGTVQLGSFGNSTFEGTAA